MQHGDRLNAAATAAVCRALVLAGLHHVQQARRAAADTITRCVKQAPSVAGVQPGIQLATVVLYHGNAVSNCLGVCTLDRAAK